jgi:hypothetical protein
MMLFFHHSPTTFACRIVRLIIEYICIRSARRTTGIVVFYFCSYSHLCLLLFLYLLIEVAVNKY